MIYSFRLYWAVLLLWAAAVVREDLKTQKISNSRIAQGLALCLAGYVLVAAWRSSWGASGPAPMPYYEMIFRHCLLSVLGGVLLWYARIWPAGDAKFYIVCSMLLPFVDPERNVLPPHLFLSFLFNIFVIASIVVLAWAIAGELRRCLTAGKARPAASWGTGTFLSKLSLPARGDAFPILAKAVFCVGNFTFIFIFQSALMKAFGNLFRPFFGVEIIYFVMFFLWEQIGPFLQRFPTFLAFGYAFLVYSVFMNLNFGQEAWPLVAASFFNALKFSALLAASRALVFSWLTRRSLQYVPAEGIRPGMVVSEKFMSKLKQTPEFSPERFGPMFRDGLTPAQARILKGWCAKLPVEDARVEMLGGQPFALWIFVGFVSVWILKGDVLHAVRRLF